MLRTEAIKAFLLNNTHEDLAQMYNHDMEVQVNVLQKDGERVEKTFGEINYTTFSNGIHQWKPFRIPHKAKSDPEYKDTKMSFSLDHYGKGIGMTGWDWVAKCSRWVAFDFDAICGHSDKHSRKSSLEDLDKIRKYASELDWVEVRYSTGGQGFHLYVHLPEVPTENHTEHAGLARAILAKMSGAVGFNFESKVDICGGNMWVWHTKMKGTRGLELLKKGEVLQEIPLDWRLHLEVIKGKRRTIKHNGLEEALNAEEKFLGLTAQSNRIELDEEHKRLLKFLDDNSLFFWWDSDHNMLVTHTYVLKTAHESLNLRGIYSTLSEGSDMNEQNCFCFPMRNGAWSVRRYTPGVDESPTWEKDSQNWTKCYFNRHPDFKTACLASGGIENEKGEFIFNNGSNAKQAALNLGSNLDFESGFESAGAIGSFFRHRTVGKAP